MPVFKAFMKIAVKLLPLISIYIGVFLGTTIAMTNSDAPNKTTSFTDSKVKVAIIDRDNSTLSKALYDYLNENHKIVEVKDDAQSIKDDLFNISVSYVLTIPEGFEEKFVAKEGQNSLKQDFLPGDSEARLVSNELSSLLNYINVNLSSGMTIDNAIAKAKETMAITVNVELTKEEAKYHPRKNVLMRALGVETPTPIEIDIFDVENTTDGILLCSDGLTNMLTEEQIEKVLVEEKTVEDAVIKLIKKANARGGNDNISVAYLKKESGDL